MTPPMLRLLLPGLLLASAVQAAAPPPTNARANLLRHIEAARHAHRQPSPSAVQGDESGLHMIRVPLSVAAESNLLRPYFDPCSTELDDQGRRAAVLHVKASALTQLDRAGVNYTYLGTVKRHAERFLPARTLQEVGVPALENLVGAEAVAKAVQQLEPRSQPTYGQGRGEGPRLDYDRYHTLQEGTDFLFSLAAAFPDITEMVDIGDTVENRDIWAIKITDNPGVSEPDEERILFTGITHAREWATHEVILYMAEYLTHGYATDPQVRRIVDQSVVWLIPVVNPDGYSFTWTDDRFWRKNRANIDIDPTIEGVDINRNYDYHWGLDDIGSSGNQGSETYRGPSPASEPETQAIQSLLESQKFAISVSLHSFSQLVLFPWGYTSDITPESYTSLRAMGEKYAQLVHSMHGMNYVSGQGSYTIYPVNGDFDDYAYGAHGSLSFTPELRPASAGAGGFVLPENQILPTSEENLAAALWLMLNTAGTMEMENPASDTLFESPGPGTNNFSLSATPVNQKPSASLGFPDGMDTHLQTYINDADHTRPTWGELAVDFEGCGTGGGYRLEAGDLPDLLAWMNALTSYRVLPYIFEDGAEVMLSNYLANENWLGIPSAEPVLMEDIRVIKRVVNPTGNDFGSGETIIGKRTALEDLASSRPWIDWNWEYVDAAGQTHVSHPTGENGASLYVQPFRSYLVGTNVRSWDFGSTTTPVYLLRFPGTNTLGFGDCNHNAIPDSDEIAGGTQQDCNGNGVPDSCDLARGDSQDCNANSTPDTCDLAGGTSSDCNANAMPDECEAGFDPLADCNENGTPDFCDIAGQVSADCTGNFIPDECEPDCNNNGAADSCDIAAGEGEDVNANGVLDECEPYEAMHVNIGHANCSAIAPGTPEMPYCNLQDAIDGLPLNAGADAVVEIIVADGTYTGERNRDIRFHGRSITLRSENGPEDCIIDAEGQARGFTFDQGETGGARVIGFTITTGFSPFGGGIFCSFAHPVIRNCRIVSNLVNGNPFIGEGVGGGVYAEFSDIALENCVIRGNEAVPGLGGGGGVVLVGGNATLRNCLLANNTTAGVGAGLIAVNGTVSVKNCTFRNNSAGFSGGAMAVLDAHATLRNTILWGDSAAFGSEVFLVAQAPPFYTLDVAFSDIEGGQFGFNSIGSGTIFWGGGNLTADPQFNNPLQGHLLSLDSPCRDAGQLMFMPRPGEVDIDGFTRVRCERVDMGASEFGLGDHNCDRVANLDDFSAWPACMTGPQDGESETACEVFDFDANDRIDLADLSAFLGEFGP